MNSGAIFSPCRTWRYSLWRIWIDSPSWLPRRDTYKNFALFIMLNPSTADEKRNDPSVSRCLRYTKDWGYDGVIVCNLFALRSTDPKELYRFDDPVGPDNDSKIRASANDLTLIVCAWGNHGKYMNRSNIVSNMLANSGFELYCLGLTKEGEPKHPLYLPKNLKPVLWKG